MTVLMSNLNSDYSDMTAERTYLIMKYKANEVWRTPIRFEISQSVTVKKMKTS